MGEWTDEDEKKHPRGTGAKGGQFVTKEESNAQQWSRQRAEERKAEEQRSTVVTKFAPWKPQEKASTKKARSSGSSGGRSRGGRGKGKAGAKNAPGKGVLAMDKYNDPAPVRALQNLLKDLGLYEGSLNGQFGRSTQAAVIEAQRKMGIKEPDGRASPTLIRQLQTAKALSPCLSGKARESSLIEGGGVSASALVSYARRPALTLVRVAREAFDESKHLRGAKGRFRDMFSMLDDWASGKGDDNPLDGFSRPALIDGAKRLGLKPNGRRWPDDDQLRKDIYAAKRAQVSGGLPAPTAAAKVKAAKAAKVGSRRPPTSDTAARIKKATSPDEVVQILDESGHTRAEMYQVAEELGVTLPPGMRKPEVIADSIASRLDGKGFDAGLSAGRKKHISDTAEKIRGLGSTEEIQAAIDDAALSRRETRLLGEELGVKVPQGITKPELIAENIAAKVAIKNKPKATKAATPRVPKEPRAPKPSVMGDGPMDDAEEALHTLSPAQLKQVADGLNLTIPSTAKTKDSRIRYLLTSVDDHRRRSGPRAYGRPDVLEKAREVASRPAAPRRGSASVPDVVDRIRGEKTPDAIVTILDREKGLSPAQLREVADSLGVELSPRATNRNAIILSIAQKHADRPSSPAEVGSPLGDAARLTGNAESSAKAIPKAGTPERQKWSNGVVKRYTSGDSIDDIAKSEGVAPSTIHRELTTRGVQLRQRGGARRRRPEAGGAGPKAGKPAKVGELTAASREQAARTRQAKIDKVRPVAEALSELDELSASDTSPQIVEERIRTRAKNSGLSPEVTDKLVQAGISGDRGRITQVMDQVAAEHGLTRISAPAGAVEKLDRTKHKTIGSSVDNGSYVRVVRPGYQSSVDGENVRLHQAVVEPATPAEIRQHLAPQLKARMADAPRVAAAKKVAAARKAREEHAARLKSALDRGMSPTEAEAFARSGMSFTEWRATHK